MLMASDVSQRICRMDGWNFRFFSAGRRLGLALLLLLTAASMAPGQGAEKDAASDASMLSGPAAAKTPASEISWIGSQSFGHFEIYVSTKWSELATTGVEYDRNVWGRVLGARLDYCADFLPVMILRQPAKTDVWGNPMTKDQEVLYGIGIAPVGARLLWRDGKRWKPYFNSKGGIAAFTKKVASQDASYENFTLQFGTGTQLRVTPRWDARMGINYFHISNAFLAPSNPGIDSIHYTFGLSYHLGGNR